MEITGERYIPSIEGENRYEHMHRYALAREYVAGKDVLDLACGEGYGCVLLSEMAASVVGVDIDSEAVEHAIRTYPAPNLTFLIGSCDAVPLPDRSVDVITSFETIEHHDRHEEMIGEIKRVLRPGGLLILSSPNRQVYADEPGYTNPFHVKELYFEELVDLLRRHFRHVRIFGQKVYVSSFVLPLEEAAARGLETFAEEGAAVARKVPPLRAPMYFIAFCSDHEPAVGADDLPVSVYVDRNDRCLQTLWTEIRKCHTAIPELHDLNHAITKQLQQAHAQLQEAHAQLQDTRTQMHEAGMQIQDLQTARAGLEAEAEGLRARICWMESSRLWKLRMRWSRFREALGTAGGG